MRARRRCGGLTLVELIIFIVILGVGLAGILTVMNVTVKGSADPMIRKQLSALAEGLLEEVMLQPFTYCDPDDANMTFACTADTTGKCSASAPVNCTVAEASGPEAGETRYSLITRFDNVNDYSGFAMTTIVDPANSPVAGLAGYSLSVSVTPAGTDFSLPNEQALRIDVTATRGAESITLTGYRFRYAPNS